MAPQGAVARIYRAMMSEPMPIGGAEPGAGAGAGASFTGAGVGAGIGAGASCRGAAATGSSDREAFWFR